MQTCFISYCTLYFTELAAFYLEGIHGLVYNTLFYANRPFMVNVHAYLWGLATGTMLWFYGNSYCKLLFSQKGGEMCSPLSLQHQ